MSQIKSPLEIYKYLPRSNCRECHLPTCLAFADAVIKGDKSLNSCPHLDKSVIEQLEGKIAKPMTGDRQQEQILEQFKKEITTIDFPPAAKRLGVSLADSRLKISSLGKNFIVDKEGNISSECHLNRWIVVPIIDYVLHSKGTTPAGKWVTFKELSNTKAMQSFFEQKCEKPLQQIADNHIELLFEYIIYVFGGKPAWLNSSTDYAYIIYPLPKVPFLVSYYKEEAHSKLNIFFDTTIEDNLSLESIHLLTVGLVAMFEKITSKHADLE